MTRSKSGGDRGVCAPGAAMTRASGSTRPHARSSSRERVGSPRSLLPSTIPPHHWQEAQYDMSSFSIGVLACPQCGGRLRLIATLHDAAVIRELLGHLGITRQGRVLVPPHRILAALPPDPILEGRGGGRRASAATRHSCRSGRHICSLTALVCARSVRLTAERGRCHS